MATEGTKSVSLVGRRLAEVRAARRMSADELANAIPGGDITKTVITNVESGRKRDLTVTEMVRIAHALDISPLMLIVDPARPWDSIDIEGIATTNIAYARDADIYGGDNSRESMFSATARSVHDAILKGVDAARELQIVGEIVDSGTSGPDYYARLPSGRIQPISPALVQSNLSGVVQTIVPRLAGAVRTLQRARDKRDHASVAEHAREQIQLLEKTLTEIQQDFPELDYTPGKVWELRRADGAPTDADQ